MPVNAGQVGHADRLAYAAVQTLNFTWGMLTAYALMRFWPWQTMDIAVLDPNFDKDVLVWINDVSEDMESRIFMSMAQEKFFPLDPGPGLEDRPTTQRIRVWTHKSQPTGFTLYKTPQTERIWVGTRKATAADRGEDWAKRAREDVARMQAEEAAAEAASGKKRDFHGRPEDIPGPFRLATDPKRDR